MITVSHIAQGSPAEKAGILPSDVIISVNGHDVNDVLDFFFYTSARKLTLLVHRGPELFDVHIHKGEYEDIGITSETFLMDQKRSCNNKCIFCFIDQNPSGMRDTIYFKDDDSRLSFLQGTYMTLTNMKDADIDRIIKMHMSPVNISVHTTNPELRCMMLNNRFAGKVLSYIPRLTNAGITVNCQIVLCKGINDGDELSRSMKDLSALYPGVASVSVVPCGLTKHRDGLYPILPYTKEDSKEIIMQIDEFAEKFKKKNGVRLFYCGDEMFLKAGLPIPPADYYDGYPQIENGVGMITSMKDEFLCELEYLCDDYDVNIKRHVSVATGEAAYSFISEISSILEDKCPNLKIDVYKIINNFFGNNVTVAGLICGCDIKDQLMGKDLGEFLMIPSVCVRGDTEKFLDETPIDEVSSSLGVRIVPCDSGGEEFIKCIMS